MSKVTFVSDVPAKIEMKPVEVSPAIPARIILELTLEEANFLRTLMGSNSGNGALRQITNSLWEALRPYTHSVDGVPLYTTTR